MAGNFARIILIILGLLRGGVALAGEPNRESDNMALRALHDKMATAVNRQDTQMLMDCFAREFAFTAVNQVVVTNEFQVQALLDRMFRSDNAFLDNLRTEMRPDIPVRFLDANVGICYGGSRDTCTMKSGKVIEMDTRWSATLVKEGGEWKVAMLHVGTDFLDNPVLDGVKKFASIFGVSAGVGSLVLGFSLGALIGRNKWPGLDRLFRRGD